MNRLTPEILRQQEDRLGPEKVQRAIDYVHALGWTDSPPMWVWQQVYSMIESNQPLPLPPHQTSSSKTGLEFLFG